MNNRVVPICVFLLAAFTSAASIAHHSVPVNFDTSGSLEVTGTITEIRWVNPHSQIFLDVVNESGEVEPWLVEMNAINTIQRLSRQLDLNVEEFIVGEPLTVVGWPGRNSNAVYFRKAILASGKEVIWESRLDPDLQKVETFD
jgi:hypothetical protein